jgi:hypothetical protein
VGPASRGKPIIRPDGVKQLFHFQSRYSPRTDSAPSSLRSRNSFSSGKKVARLSEFATVMSGT